MKFDLIGAMKDAYEIVGHECVINCTHSDGMYIVQIKVVVPYPTPMRGSKVYGQQIAFREEDVYMDEWFLMNQQFKNAIHSLKMQIEGEGQ
jgi:hypothetical protein